MSVFTYCSRILDVSGLACWATTDSTFQGVTFWPSGQRIPTPAPGLDIAFTIASDGGGWAAMKSAGPGVLLVSQATGSVRTLPDTVGRYAHAFIPGHDLIALQLAGVDGLTVYDFSGQPTGQIIPMVYDPAYGIYDIRVDANGQFSASRGSDHYVSSAINGVKVVFAESDGDWTVGMAEAHTGIILGNANTGETCMWGVDSPNPPQFPPRLTVVAGVPYVSLSWEDVPAPDAFPRTPYVKPLPPPAPSLPAIVIGPQRALWLDDMSGLVPTNCGGTGTNGAILEDVDWLTEADKPKLLALYFGKEMPPHLGGSKSDHYQRTYQAAKVIGVPVAVYDDGDDTWANDWTKLAETDGLRCWRLFNCYLRLGESDEALERRIGLKVEAETRPCGLVLPGYLVGGASPEVTARSYYAAMRIWQANPQVVAVLFFGLDRAA